MVYKYSMLVKSIHVYLCFTLIAYILLFCFYLLINISIHILMYYLFVVQTVRPKFIIVQIKNVNLLLALIRVFF